MNIRLSIFLLSLLIIQLVPFRAVNAANYTRQQDKRPDVSVEVTLGVPDQSHGPVIPVEGPDGLLWLCREDEEAKQSICIPWFQDAISTINEYYALHNPEWENMNETRKFVISVEDSNGYRWLCGNPRTLERNICIPLLPERNGPAQHDSLSDFVYIKINHDDTNGPVIPVEGPDGTLWLCREDDEAQQSICIPWMQEKESSNGAIRGDVNQDAVVDNIDFELLEMTWPRPEWKTIR